jgi:hypothetical protein
MAPDPVVAVSSDGGSSGDFCRCLAPLKIGTGLSVELD